MPPQDNAPLQAVGFWQALRFWFKLGWVSFGGPAGQIALMHAELVERRRWISEKRFLHALNYCMLLPGPEAQQLATYIGWLLHRTWGGVVAGVLFVLPSLLILIALSWLYMAWGDTPIVAGVLYGIKPAVVALVLQAAHRIGLRTLRNRSLWALAVLSFLAIWALALPFPWIVLSAAVLGALGGRYLPAHFGAVAGHAVSVRARVPALIDDDTVVPEHARFALGRLWRVLLAGALLWALPMGLLWAVCGMTHPLTQMAWFFTKAALLTFGGAYAVLPYVHQGAVEQFAWLTAGQMMDGLALGETTPGPLIMVVAFVGFVAGYAQALLGPQAPWLAGVAAACLVTWFTFLPSFVFILAGGPVVESTRNVLRLTAPLSAITAAVVGVILQLALFFASHVLWPQGLSAPLDARAACITAGAALALLRFKRSAVEVIVLCAVAGGLLSVLK
jgi:chromate transporter